MGAKLLGIINKKFIILLVIVIGVLFYWLFFIRGERVKFETFKVVKTNLSSSLEVTGIISSEEIVDLAFKTSGEVTAVNYKVGDIVKKGQVVASLNRRELEINLSQKEALLRSAQSDVDKVLDDIRHSQYYQQTGNETETQKNLREKAEAARDAAFEAWLAAKNALNTSVLTTPISGVITDLKLKVGETVGANTKVVQIANLQKPVFVVDVDEDEIGKIEIGKTAKINLDAYPEKQFFGKVSKIYPATSLTSTGAVIVKVEISFDDFPNLPILGLSGKAEILVDQVSNVLAVPNEAILEDGSGSYVFVVERTGRAMKRRVTLGLTNDEMTEITDGVSEGEIIVISNLDKIKNGQRI